MSVWVPTEPRCVPLNEAAAHFGLTPSGFRHWVAIGRFPGALSKTRRWDRRAIDVALDRLSGPSASGTLKLERHPIMLDHMRRSLRRRDTGGIRLA